MARKGFIKLHRQIIEHDFFKEPRKFSKFEAWLYILLEANYEEETKRLYGQDISIPIGSFATSYIQLAKAWNWDKKAVIKFIDYLVQEKMITIEGTKTDPKSGTKTGTIINVDNWAFYQSDRTKSGTKSGTKTDPKKPSSFLLQKEEKNIKKAYAEFVSMTEIEYQKLVDAHGESATKRMVEILDNYKGSSGKKYASDYKAILTWVVKRYEEDKAKGIIKETQQSIFQDQCPDFL